MKKLLKDYPADTWIEAAVQGDPNLAKTLRNAGTITMVKDGWRYSLIYEGRAIFRKKVKEFGLVY